jgi:hypothetical protein
MHTIPGKTIQNAVELLRKAANPVRIILFGSVLREKEIFGREADLLARRRVERSRNYIRRLSSEMRLIKISGMIFSTFIYAEVQ